LWGLALEDLFEEVERLVTGKAYPQLIRRRKFISQSRHESKRILANTGCPVCHGGHNGALHSNWVVPAPQVLASAQIADRTGGTRSLSLEESKKIAEQFCKDLGVDPQLLTERDIETPMSFEKDACAFAHVQPKYSLLPENPHIFSSGLVLEDNDFGKGANSSQAWCSGVFELFERKLSRYSGNVPMVPGS